MLSYLLFVAVVATAGSLSVNAEQRFIKEITEGPYQHYSGQPLVDLGGKFYYFEINIPSDWSQATSFCRNLGLFLVSIEDATENDLIKNYILTNIGAKDYWTSGNDVSLEGSFVWASTGRPFVFTDWHNGQPDDGGRDGEDLVGLWHSEGSLHWNDFGTDAASLYALCEEEV
ncbi:hypothetical protein B566_EDAN012207 [Ephemera danica]|nr:hypothetical protein B566_EDAN012207 [Ephemera danica]